MEDKSVYKNKSFIHESEELKIITKYYKKIENKNYIYFECSKRRAGCPGKCKYDKNKDIWILDCECNTINRAWLFNIWKLEEILNSLIKKWNMKRSKVTGDDEENLELKKDYEKFEKKNLDILENNFN